MPIDDPGGETVITCRKNRPEANLDAVPEAGPEIPRRCRGREFFPARTKSASGLSSFPALRAGGPAVLLESQGAGTEHTQQALTLVHNT